MKNRKFVFVYYGESELCAAPLQAVDFINRLKCYGKGAPLSCNSTCEKLIHALFEGEIVNSPATGNIKEIHYNGKTIPGFRDLATTGCSTTRIKFFPALADTLEEHNLIYEKQSEAAKKARIIESKRLQDKRIQELTEQRRGWYAVSMQYGAHVFDNREGVRITDFEFTGSIIADSGMNAYEKTIEHLEKTKDGEILHVEYPHSTSNDFWFEFLGMKTDDGYSVQEWEDSMTDKNLSDL